MPSCMLSTRCGTCVVLLKVARVLHAPCKDTFKTALKRALKRALGVVAAQESSRTTHSTTRRSIRTMSCCTPPTRYVLEGRSETLAVTPTS